MILLKNLIDYRVGDTIEMFLLIKQSIQAVTQQGKPYMTVILQDKTADVEAKLWDTSEEHAVTYAGGNIVKVGGELHDYRGRTQLRVKSIRPAKESDGVTLEDLLPSAERPKEELYEIVTRFIDAMDNDAIRRLTKALVKKYEAEFLVYPAATRNHHDYVSGLIDHTVSMLTLGEQIARLYPILNKDLLYAGIILHDVGKVTELSGPIATQYTVEGNLIGHISIMVSEILLMAKELDIEGEEVMLLQHMVLSHHGKEEWGSPKRPMLMEAEILHYIDNIDAKMQMFGTMMAATEEGTFSERVFALDNRSFYKPTL